MGAALIGISSFAFGLVLGAWGMYMFLVGSKGQAMSSDQIQSLRVQCAQSRWNTLH